jgi:hypothetical protein
VKGPFFLEGDGSFYFNKRRMNMSKLVDIEGVGPVNARKLLKAGVRATGSLLKRSVH